MSDEENLKLARAAVFHVLDAIRSDPRKYWLMGEGTESFAKLTESAAAFLGKDQETVRKNFYPDAKKYAAYEREREEQSRILEGRKEVEAALAPEAPTIPCPECGGHVEPKATYYTSGAICCECFARLRLEVAA